MRLIQEHHKFEASPGNSVRPCLKTNTKKGLRRLLSVKTLGSISSTTKNNNNSLVENLMCQTLGVVFPVHYLSGSPTWLHEKFRSYVHITVEETGSEREI